MDGLETDTRALCLPNGRRVGQPGHDVAREYVLSRLDGIGLTPFAGDSFALPYTRPHPENGRPTEFTNLVGVVPGRERDLAPLLIGAHYDSIIDAPCADDNATAVAITLAAAETLSDAGLGRDLIIAVFDAEEPPFFHTEAMGSTRFVQDHCREVDFACALIMDLVGHDVEVGDLPLRDLLFVLGAESHVALPGVVERATPQVPGLRVMASLNEYIGDMSDHHVFNVSGQPFLFLSCGRGRHYHTPADTIDWVNFDKVQRVCELVLTLTRELDAASISGGAEPSDPVDFEIRTIREAIGPTLPMLLQMAGLERLETRGDITRFARAIARDVAIV